MVSGRVAVWLKICFYCRRGEWGIMKFPVTLRNVLEETYRNKPWKDNFYCTN